MQLVYGQDNAVALWVARQLQLSIHPPYVAIGVVADDGRELGGMVFNDWNGANMEVTVYGPRALNRMTLRAAFNYVFNEAKAIRLTARTKRNNKRMRKLLLRIGFEYEGTMKDYFGRSDDAMLFRLTPQAAAKWM